MATREVIGCVKRADGTAWDGATLKVALERASYRAGQQYPVSEIETQAASDGAFSFVLWCNTEGYRASRYILTLPDGSRHKFWLPPGNTAIDWSLLQSLWADGSRPSAPATPTGQPASFYVLEAILGATVPSEFVLPQPDVVAVEGFYVNGVRQSSSRYSAVEQTVTPVGMDLRTGDGVTITYWTAA